MNNLDAQTIRVGLHEMNDKIDHAKDVLGRCRWNEMSYTKRRLLVDVMTKEMSDNELWAEYLRITKEETVNV